MDDNISYSIARSSFRVRLNGSSLMVVPQGALEQVVISALCAGTDVSVLGIDNDSYKLNL